MFGNDLDYFRKVILATTLCVSLALNLWGTAVVWHPDEITERAIAMFDSRTLNHHNFAYGALHYYQVIVLAVLPAKALNKVLSLGSTAPEAIALVLSRAVSALFGTGVVLTIFLLANELFDPNAALYTALLLTT